MTKQRFWERWLKGETRERLIEWLESQGAFVGMDEAEYKKYTLKKLQYLTFEEDFAFFWATIDKKFTGLPVDLRIDEIGSQRTPELLHYSEPLLTFQNSYDGRIYTDVLPMSISKNPQVLEDDEFIKIKSEDVEAVKQFVVQHHDLLMKHWRQEITTMELHEILKKEAEQDEALEKLVNEIKENMKIVEEKLGI
ncbi:MAG: hypothetical protein J6N45_07845 [Alphaproteobacteria bacterium]|nr:hypothetical protein [Alphaproteobacteria bacterium]